MHRSTRRPRASVARGAPRAVGLLVGADVPRPPTAHADSVGCRADPGVLLSDGTVVDFSAAIAAAAADVRGGDDAPPHTPAGGGIVARVLVADPGGVVEAGSAVGRDGQGLHVRVSV